MSLSEYDEMPTTVGKRRRRPARRSSRSKFLSSSPPAAASSDDDIEIVKVAKKTAHSTRRQKAHDDNDDEDEDGEDGEPVTPRRRGIKRPRLLSRREQEDLVEDLDFLGPSSDVEEGLPRRPRNTQTAEKDARQKALESLKRKRSGKPPGSEEDGEAEAGSEDPQSAYELEMTAQDSSARSVFQADEDDEKFVVDEGEDEVLGVPDGVPLQFTRYASMKARELFKFAIEWMVQKKINPAFRRDDEIYDLTFQKLDDEVKGLVGSKYASAAWTRNFTVSLKSRPSIAIHELDRTNSEHFMMSHCDACNRSNHPATYQVQFQGKPYSQRTLDVVESADDDEDSDDSSGHDSEAEDRDGHPAYDDEGREVPAASIIYYVGRFCMSNAETAHELQHWRLHLYKWVVQWIDANGYSTAEKLVERDRWSTKKRRKYANRIADRMEKEGVVKKLWREFRDSIDRAAESKQGRWE